MEIQQLKYVCAVAETASFSRAAEKCKVAQPSLSQQVLKLEEELGTRLFDRLGRRIQPTEAGQAFLLRARAALAELELARASVVEQASDLRGSVSVGVIPTIAPFLMPKYASAFLATFDEARLRLVEEVTPMLVEGLRDLSIDIALLALPLRHKDLELTPLQTEPLFVAMAKDHALASKKTLALKDLKSESFVMLRDGHCFRDLSIAACTHARITPNITFESGQLSSLLAMVAAGIGISFVPAMAVGADPNCHYARVQDPRISRTIVVATLRGRSFNRVQQGLLDLLKAHTRSAKAR